MQLLKQDHEFIWLKLYSRQTAIISKFYEQTRDKIYNCILRFWHLAIIYSICKVSKFQTKLNLISSIGLFGENKLLITATCNVHDGLLLHQHHSGPSGKMFLPWWDSNLTNRVASPIHYKLHEMLGRVGMWCRRNLIQVQNTEYTRRLDCVVQLTEHWIIVIQRTQVRILS